MLALGRSWRRASNYAIQMKLPELIISVVILWLEFCWGFVFQFLNTFWRFFRTLSTQTLSGILKISLAIFLTFSSYFLKICRALDLYSLLMYFFLSSFLYQFFSFSYFFGILNVFFLFLNTAFFDILNFSFMYLPTYFYGTQNFFFQFPGDLNFSWSYFEILNVFGTYLGTFPILCFWHIFLDILFPERV